MLILFPRRCLPRLDGNLQIPLASHPVLKDSDDEDDLTLKSTSEFSVHNCDLIEPLQPGMNFKLASHSTLSFSSVPPSQYSSLPVYHSEGRLKDL